MEKIKLGAAVPAIPTPLCLLGSTVDGKDTFCTIAWFTIIDDEPPTIGLILAKKRYTKDCIIKNKTFSVNIPNKDIARQTDYCGIHSGYDLDKSKIFKTYRGELDNAPLIKDCPVNVECRLKNIIEFEGTDMIVGEIVNLYADENVISIDKIDATVMNPLIYFTNGSVYYSLGEEIGKAFKIGKECPPYE